MPVAAPRWCARCGQGHAGDCPLGVRQARQQTDAQRGSSAQRGYDAYWRGFRLGYLSSHPMCHDCQEHGQYTVANEVHHIIALSDGGERLDPANCMSLCHSCHSKRTARGE